MPIVPSKSARSSNSISSNTLFKRSRSKPSINRNCSSSGNSSNTSARRSSSMAAAIMRRCSIGREAMNVATSLGCILRSRAASAAIGVVGAKSDATSCQSTNRNVGRASSELRLVKRTLATYQAGWWPPWYCRATSATVSSPHCWSKTSAASKRSPSRVRNGFKSRS